MVTLASARDERLLAAAARAGCVCLFLGLESFRARSLELANKSFNVVESYGEVVARIHAHGITVQAGIVFGFDGDDEGTFENTLVEATRLGLDGATVSLLTPFPGTPLFQQLERDGRLLTRDWSYYNGKTAVTFRPARMSPEALWNGYMWFRRHFFSRSCILERLRRSGVRPLQSFALNWGYREFPKEADEKAELEKLVKVQVDQPVYRFGDPNARVDLGICYDQLALQDSNNAPRYFAMAVQEMRTVADNAPTHQPAAFNLGIVNLHMGNLEESNKWFKRAVELGRNTELGMRAQKILQQHTFSP